jgi:hypothetical protein
MAGFILAPRHDEGVVSVRSLKIIQISAKATGPLESNDGIIWAKRSLKLVVRSVHDSIEIRS